MKALQLWDAHVACRKMRQTAERRSILTAALSLKGHFTATMLYNNLRDSGLHFSIATVYSSLSSFVDAGIFIKVNIGNHRGAMYERSINLAGSTRSGHRHIHVVCTSCHRVAEVKQPYTPLSAINSLGLTLPSSFDIKDISLVIYGLCAKCVKSKGKESHKTDIEQQP
ncbi:MAG: transcriptional repressor [Pseudoflavonifractor sp.]|nr:transcriptional repressor [Alloprevotella sp.]MCM1117029.1 transcriptional repressor [Pseudoflavonifractor sp.]